MPTDAEMVRKNARTGGIVALAIMFMIAAAFASAPLYRLFCQKTGFAGTPQRGGALPSEILDQSVTVRFNADTDPSIPWDFAPGAGSVNIRIGQKGMTSFKAHNRLSKPLTGVAVFNVVPEGAGAYFHKIQCFCFGNQTLQPGQSVDMPVVFYVDPAIARDPDFDTMRTITLSYTFYKAESESLEKALEGGYTARAE